jgi:hypothetical protein
MAIKVNDADGTIVPIDTSQDRKDDRMITSEGDDSRKSLPLQTWTFLACIGVWFSGQDSIMTLFDLLDGPGVVVAINIKLKQTVRELDLLSNSTCKSHEEESINIRSHRNIPTIQDPRPAVKRIRVQGDIVTAAETHSS